MPGFLELQLNDTQGTKMMNANYHHKAAQVVARMNASAAAAKGNNIGWLVWKFAGEDSIAKLLDGPSYIATQLHHVDILDSVKDSKDPLITKHLMVEEEMVLLGYIVGAHRHKPQYLFPTLQFLLSYLRGFLGLWTDDAENVMQK